MKQMCLLLSLYLIFDWSITTYKRDAIDAMTVVQSIDMKKHKTFGDLAANYFWDLVHCFTFVNSVADIFDRYDITKSTTSAERERYSKVSASAKVFQVIDGRTIPDWKKLLSAQENKQALINVFGTYLLQIVRNDQVVQPGHTLYVAGIFGNPEVVNIFFQSRSSLIVLVCAAVRRSLTPEWSCRRYMPTKTERDGKERTEYNQDVRYMFGCSLCAIFSQNEIYDRNVGPDGKCK